MLALSSISIPTMEFHLYTKSHALVIVSCIILVLWSLVGECTEAQQPSMSFDYHEVNCRRHTALLTEFGAVGDGKALNTKAFQTAVEHLKHVATDGGAMLIVPPGQWLTGAFNITSHFTLYIHKDAVILGSQDESLYPLAANLPSYGQGRDGAGRHSSLIFGTNLTDVVITGGNGTINGQGKPWWEKFRTKQYNDTRPYLIEILYSDNVQISNITLVDSPSWFVHPTYCRDVLVQGVTILSSIDSANTDGIDPDSCSNIRIEDCFIVSGDDCIAVKSGWDHYGYNYGMPTENLVIRRLTCISPDSAAIALGSEMSGGIKNVWAEDVTAIDTQSAIRIKTGVGRGGFVKDIYARRFTIKTMKYVFRMTGNYAGHPEGWDPKALPEITRINFRDMVAENVTYAARFDPMQDILFKEICISNVTIGLTAEPKELQWNCTNIAGVTSRVTPKPCDMLPASNAVMDCPYPEPPKWEINLKTCSYVGSQGSGAVKG